MPRTRFEDDPHDDYDEDPRPAQQRSSNTGLIVGLLVAGGLLVVLVCGGGLAYFLFASAAKGPANAPAATMAEVKGEPVEQFGNGDVLDVGNGNSIVKEFAANPTAAEKKWFGKRVRFFDDVVRIDRDEAGWYVAFENSGIIMIVHIAPGEEANFSSLQKGTSIEIEATLTRFTITGQGGVIRYLWGEKARLVGVKNKL